MHVSTVSARFCRLAARSAQFCAPLLDGAGNKRCASNPQRASSLATSAIVGVAANNNGITATSIFSMAIIPDRRFDALIVPRTAFGSLARYELLMTIRILVDLYLLAARHANQGRQTSAGSAAEV